MKYIYIIFICLFSKYRCITDWSNIRCIQLRFHPSLYLFLEQFDEICSNVSSIIIHTGKHSVLITVSMWINSISYSDSLNPTQFCYLYLTNCIH
jgi:hypothetical protein